jgi:ligand-binding SRPBCC domain-containing protein
MGVARNRAELTTTSRIAAPPRAVWERVITADGIRDEMRPWIRMTLPADIDSLDPETVPLGEPLGRSWLLAFGFIPFDYDEICLVRIEPGRSFLERSRMLSQRVWEHERTITDAPGGCTVTDRVAWEPRGPLPARWAKPVIGWFFRHRHRRLRRHFKSWLRDG